MAGKKLNAAIGALALFAVWTAATWLFEGRIETFLRPDAVVDRLLYVGVANLGVGIVGALLVLRFAIRVGGTSRIDAGFGPRAPSVLRIAVGIVLGLAAYVLQGAPSLDPIVVLNAYAQVLAVSVAEVLVCWAVVGAIAKGALGRSRWFSATGGAVVASVLFGLYHFGHSPPFDSVEMVVFLAAIGLVTSAFFFAARDAYATVAFHNFLGVFGVLQALERAGRLDALATPQVPLLVTATVLVLVLAVADALLIRGAGGS